MNEERNIRKSITQVVFAAQSRGVERLTKELKEDDIAAHFGCTEQTLLHYAANNKDARVAEELIKRKATVDAINITQATPLHLAVLHARPDVVRVLLDHKADSERRDNSGRTALGYAADFDIAELLLKRRANPDAALRNSNLCSDAKYFLSGCVNPDSGATLLHQAACWSRRDLIVLLLAHGANPQKPNANGKTPEDFFNDLYDNRGVSWQDLVQKAEAQHVLTQLPMASFE